MAFIDTFAKYHTLSKYPVDENTSLANVRNKSGHTVTTSDIWASEIPAFFVVYDDDTRNSLAATEGDLCTQGSTLYEYKNGAWSVRNALVDGEVIGGIIKYHKGCKAVILTDTNNSGTGGNGYSVRIRPNSDTSGTGPFISSFISSMDKVVNGIPSVGYDPVVHDTTSSTGFRGEGTGTDDYIANCYGGVITFNKKRTDAETKITIDCFEYIGEKLNTSITDLAKKVESVTATAGEGVQAVTDAATTAGLSVSTKTITVEGQADPVSVKALDIDVANVNAQGVVTTGDGAKLVTATGAQNIANKVASDKITAATLADGKVIATATGDDTTKLVTVEDVTTYVSILEQKVNDHLLDAAGKLEISVLADKLPKKSFFEDENFYVKSYGFEWEKLANNIYPNKFEVKVAQSVDGLTAFKAPSDGSSLTPSPLAAQTCKLVVYSIDDAKNLTEVAVSQANTYDASTSIYTFKFENQISLIAGGRYRFCFRNNETNALHCLPVIMNSSLGSPEIKKNDMINRYVTGETEDDYWGCWGTLAGQLNGAAHYTYGPKLSISGLTPTSDEDGKALSGEKGKIYLIPNEGTENQNVYDEYVWTNDTWEKIGSTEVDLTDYVTTGELEEAISTAKPANYVKSVTVGSTTTSGETALIINDGRTKVYPNDLWGTTVSMVGKTVTVQSNPIDGTAWGPKNGYNTKSFANVNGISYPQGSKPITKVENNMVYNGTTEVANIKTNEIVNGDNMFYGTSLTSFNSDLSSLTNGDNMFYGTSLTSFNSDLSKLFNSHWMFCNSSLESFSSDLSSLVNGEYMFSYNAKFESFSGDLSSLVIGEGMFYRTSIESFSGDLSKLVDGSNMFGGTPLSSFSSDLSSLVNGYRMFYGTSLSSFSGDLSSLVNGDNMFNSTQIKSFSGDLSSLVNGHWMFTQSSLSSFSGDLSSLVNGEMMFYATPLTSFSGDLSSLVNGKDMFYGTSIESFSGDLSSLVNGKDMFYGTSIESFSGDLSSLVNGMNMFYQCESLTSFSGDLSSLVCGNSMFQTISLDVESVELICDVLPNYNIEQLQTATWNESGENKGKYTYTDWSSGRYYYPIIKISDNYYSMSQGNVDGFDRIFGTDWIDESNVKTISIYWKDISVLSEADRTKIAELFTNTATEKGWTFLVNTEIAESGKIAPPNAVMATDGTIQYYILAKKDEATEDNATHIDASGKLWKFDTAEAIIGPNIKYWSIFATVEDALTEWGLTPWTKPAEEETEA